jgi:hypothetical protein
VRLWRRYNFEPRNTLVEVLIWAIPADNFMPWANPLVNP